jgi:hypothetical protein
MTEELIALREEIQRDRIVMQKTINDGFDRVCDKVENHEIRISSVERSQRTFNWILGTSVTASLGAFFTWLVGR